MDSIITTGNVYLYDIKQIQRDIRKIKEKFGISSKYISLRSAGIEVFIAEESDYIFIALTFPSLAEIDTEIIVLIFSKDKFINSNNLSFIQALTEKHISEDFEIQNVLEDTPEILKVVKFIINKFLETEANIKIHEERVRAIQNNTIIEDVSRAEIINNDIIKGILYEASIDKSVSEGMYL